jgi:hypothetical protein
MSPSVSITGTGLAAFSVFGSVVNLRQTDWQTYRRLPSKSSQRAPRASPGPQARKEHERNGGACLHFTILPQHFKDSQNFIGRRGKRLGGRGGSFGNHCANDGVRRIESAHVPGESKNAAQPTLAMLQRRAPDYLLAMNLREHLGRVHRPKIEQGDFLQVRLEIGIPHGFVSRDG